MDLLYKTNRTQIHEFCQKVKIEEIFILQLTVLKSGDLLGRWKKLEKFSTISKKLRQIGQKTH